jgi:hypothetical protein
MPDVVVPEFAMDSVRISGLPELQAHMQELTNDPSSAFNPKLFDDVELQLTGKPPSSNSCSKDDHR